MRAGSTRAPAGCAALSRPSNPSSTSRGGSLVLAGFPFVLGVADLDLAGAVLRQGQVRNRAAGCPRRLYRRPKAPAAVSGPRESNLGALGSAGTGTGARGGTILFVVLRTRKLAGRGCREQETDNHQQSPAHGIDPLLGNALVYATRETEDVMI